MRSEVGLRRTSHHFTVCVKARAVTRAIPDPLRFMPTDNATEMRANRAVQANRPRFIAVSRHLLAVQTQDTSLARFEILNVARLSTIQSAFYHVIGIILVLGNVVP